jgi:hypothetical protein
MSGADALSPYDALRHGVQRARARHGSVKAAVAEVARRFAISVRKVESVWWGERLTIEWEEGERIRRIALAMRQAQEQADREYAATRANIEAVRARMRTRHAEDRSAQDAGEGPVRLGASYPMAGQPDVG